MDIVVSHAQGRVPVTVFRIKGEINMNTYEQLEAEARTAFKAGARDMLLDLSEVTYITSAGLRTINYIFKLLHAELPDASQAAMHQGLRDGTFKSPHLKLLNPQPAVQQALRLAGFDMFLETHASLEEAVASF
jgi:anti-anti-sigma regulatory factor